MAPNNTIIEVDPAYNTSGDEGYDDALTKSSTDSLTASIYNYRYENGRRYHAYREGAYPFPNDETEQDRLDVVHHISLLLSSSRLHHIPPPFHPQRILDIGTGTGIWAIDIAEVFPAAHVIGTDLSPIQPSWVPPNVEFQIDDVETPWSWSEPFDFIHIRCLNGSILDWPKLLQQALKATRPGGWIEVDEYAILMFSDDGSLGVNSAMRRWCELFQRGIESFGKGLEPAALGGMLESAGWNVKGEELYKVPVGTWPKDKATKELGAFYLMQAASGFEAYGMALFTRVLEMEKEDAEKVVREAEKECRSRKVHAYVKRFVYWAQKLE